MSIFNMFKFWKLKSTTDNVADETVTPAEESWMRATTREMLSRPVSDFLVWEVRFLIYPIRLHRCSFETLTDIHNRLSGVKK